MIVSIAALRAGRDPNSMTLDFPGWDCEFDWEF